MLTFQEITAYLINNHPSLYASHSLEHARHKVMDQTLNTIGNGIEKTIFLESYKEPIRPEYISGEPIYYRESQGLDTSVITQKEAIDLGLDVDDLLPLNNDASGQINRGYFDSGSRRLYPCFNKHYSLIWANEISHSTTNYNQNTGESEEETLYKVKVSDLQMDWFEAAQEFYTRSLAFFSDPYACRNYHSAFNSYDKAIRDNSIKSMTKMLGKYSSHQEITQAYGTHFDGNVPDFLERRWEKERKRIFDFCEMTLVHIQNIMDLKNAQIETSRNAQSGSHPVNIKLTRKFSRDDQSQVRLISEVTGELDPAKRHVSNIVFVKEAGQSQWCLVTQGEADSTGASFQNGQVSHPKGILGFVSPGEIAKLNSDALMEYDGQLVAALLNPDTAVAPQSSARMAFGG